MDDDAKLDAAIRAAAAEESAALTGHPAPEELLAYHLGTLEAEERDHLQEHLALCPECTAVVLDFEAFPGGAEEVGEERAAPPLPPERLEAEWEKLRARVATTREQELPRRVVPLRKTPEQAAPAGAARALRRAYALAAVFFLATVGLAVWVARLLPGEDALPRVGVAVESLSPRGGDTVRGGPEEVRVRLDAAPLVLRLNLGDWRRWDRYSVVLFDHEGRELWSHPDVPRAADGTFSVELPQGFLTPGRYELRLSGVGEEAGEELGAYDFTVVEE